MKIVAWNVNSLKVRLPQLLDFLATRQPDVVCLQETKLEDHNFPKADIEAAGYQVAFSGQKTYNGVAILSRLPMVCVYIPNGQSVDSDKYQYKLKWLAALTGWLKEELAQHPKLALLGDYNIAPDDRDVHDPVAWKDQVLCTEAEREAFGQLLAIGLKDSFRLFEQPEKIYSWWDYRMMGFRRNMGMRIDHILLTQALAENCTASVVERDMRKLERPSDHAPVMATLGI